MTPAFTAIASFLMKTNGILGTTVSTIAFHPYADYRTIITAKMITTHPAITGTKTAAGQAASVSTSIPDMGAIILKSASTSRM